MRICLRAILQSFLLCAVFFCVSAGVSCVASQFVEEMQSAGVSSQICDEQKVSSFVNAMSATSANETYRNIQQTYSSRVEANQQHNLFKSLSVTTSLRLYARNSRDVFAPSRPAQDVPWSVFLHHLII